MDNTGWENNNFVCLLLSHCLSLSLQISLTLSLSYFTLPVYIFFPALYSLSFSLSHKQITITINKCNKIIILQYYSFITVVFKINSWKPLTSKTRLLILTLMLGIKLKKNVRVSKKNIFYLELLSFSIDSLIFRFPPPTASDF